MKVDFKNFYKDFFFILLLMFILFLVSIVVNPIKAQEQEFILVDEYIHVATDVYHDTNGDRYVTIKDGRLYKNGELFKTYPTNVTGERGLLSVCVFNDELYVNVTSKDGRYQNILRDDELLLQVDYTNDPPTVPPYATVHRGGDLVEFEDKLFVSFGMGFHVTTSQDPFDYRGKVVEIYPLEHIVITGLRNPFRFDYDGINFWIADVGGNHREEITMIENFGTPNLGWPCWEGTYEHTDSCGQTVPPTFEYKHTGNQNSITGGVYHNGGYYFCDHYSGNGGKLHLDGGVEPFEFPQGVTSMDVYDDTLFVLTWLGDLWALPLMTTTTIDPGPEYIIPPDAATQTYYFDILGRQVSRIHINDKAIINRRILYGIPY